MPFKTNAARRHRIPKQQHRVTNWAEYDAALRQRGSLTVWFSQEAIAAWRAEPRTTPGGQPHYSALAIRTALTLRAVFRLALRQTEGLIRLDPRTPESGSGRARSLNPEPAGRNPGGTKAMSELRRACSPAGGQHRPASVRTRRVADREARHHEDAGPGASCISASMPRPGRSSHQS